MVIGKTIFMNGKNLKKMHIQWTDLLRGAELAEHTIHYDATHAPRVHPPIPAGIYPQSSISDIVDEYRGMKTMGRCYTKPTFEAKISH